MKAIANRLTQVARMAALAFAVLAVGSAWAATTTGTVYEPWSYSAGCVVWRATNDQLFHASTVADVAANGTIGSTYDLNTTGHPWNVFASTVNGQANTNYTSPGLTLIFDKAGCNNNSDAQFAPLSLGGMWVNALQAENTPYCITDSKTDGTDRKVELGAANASTYFKFDESFTFNRNSATKVIGTATVEIATDKTFTINARANKGAVVESGNTLILKGAGTLAVVGGLTVNGTIDLSAATRPTIDGDVGLYGTIVLPAGTEVSPESPFTICTGTLSGLNVFVKIGDAEAVEKSFTAVNGAITAFADPIYEFTNDYPTVVPAGKIYKFIGGETAETAVTVPSTVNVSGTLETSGFITVTYLANTNGAKLDVIDGTTTIICGNKALAGDVVVEAGATLKNGNTDAVNWDDKFIAKIYGTLDMGATRWSLGSNNTLNFYEGCTVTGNGQGSNGALDWIENKTGAVNIDGDVTIDACIRLRGGATMQVSASHATDCLTLNGTLRGSGTVTCQSGSVIFPNASSYYGKGSNTVADSAYTGTGVKYIPQSYAAATVTTGSTTLYYTDLASAMAASESTSRITLLKDCAGVNVTLAPGQEFVKGDYQIGTVTGALGEVTNGIELVYNETAKSYVCVDNRESTWTNASNDGTWANANNWSTYRVPTRYTTVKFNNGAEVTYSSAVPCGGIIVDGTATINGVANIDVQLYGNVTDGSASGGSKVVLNTASLKNMLSETVTVATALDIAGTCGFAAGGSTKVGVTVTGAVVVADNAVIKPWDVDHTIQGAVTFGEGFSTGNGDHSLVLTGNVSVAPDKTATIPASKVNIDDATFVGNGRVALSATRSSALKLGSNWTGTVVLPAVNGTDGGFRFDYYGKTGSTVEIANGFTGWLNADEADSRQIKPTISIVDGSQFTISGTNANTWYNIARLTGAGNFSLVQTNLPSGDSGNAGGFHLLNVEDYTGTIANSIGSGTPTPLTISKVTLAAAPVAGQKLVSTTTPGTVNLEAVYVGNEKQTVDIVKGTDGIYVAAATVQKGETVTPYATAALAMAAAGNDAATITLLCDTASDISLAVGQTLVTDGFSVGDVTTVEHYHVVNTVGTYTVAIDTATLTVLEVANATATVTVSGVEQSGVAGEGEAVYTFDYGTAVTVTYTPDTYYSITAGDAEQVITITADTSAVAPTVTRNTVTVTVPTVDNASVNVAYTAGGVSQTGTTADTYTVDQGTAVIVTYTAGEGYFFGDEATKVLEYTTVVTAPEITTADTGETSAAVAKIDTTYYPTLASAMSDATVSATAQSPVTVTMLTACTESATITVPANVTLDINGKGVTSGAKVVLNGGTLVNNGPSYNTYGVAADPAIVAKLELTADSTVGGTGNFHIRAANHAESKLTLNGYTLTKSGTNTFFLDNTQSDEAGDKVGTINVVGGHLGIFRWGTSYTGVNLDCNVELNNGSSELFFAYNYAKATIRNLSGSGKVTGNYDGIDLNITGSLTLPIYQAPTPSIALDDGSTLVLTATGLDSAYGNKLVVGGTSTVDVDLTALTINAPVTLVSWTTAPAGSFTTDDLPAAYKLVKDTDGLKVAYNQYTVTLPEVANATATVTVGNVEQTAPYTFDYGTVVTVTWAPVSSAWKVTSNAQVIELTGNVTAGEPTVAPNEKTFTVVVPDNMTVTVDGVPYTANTEITRTIGTSVTIVYTVTGQFVGETQQQVVEITGDTVSIPTPGNYVAPVTAVAEVGGVYKATLAEAVAAVEDGETVTMLADHNVGAERIQVSEKSFTVALNGTTLSSDEADAIIFRVSNGKTIAIDGTVEGSTLVGSVMIAGGTEGHIVANGGTYENDLYCPFYANGTCSVASTISIAGATIVANDTNPADSDAETGFGLYQAGPATVTITGTEIMAAKTGVEVRAGNLTIENTVITANGDPSTATANGNGGTVVGAAIAVSPHNTNKSIELTVNSGTFTGAKAVYENYLENKDRTATTSIALNGGTFRGDIDIVEDIGAVIPTNSTARFSDATADGVEEGYGLVPVANSDLYEVVKFFSVTYKNGDEVLWTGYVAPGATTPAFAGEDPTKDDDVEDNGTTTKTVTSYAFVGWGEVAATVTEDVVYTATFNPTVTVTTYVATVNNERYETLAEAVSAAQAGDTVRMIANETADANKTSTDDRLVVTKAITIDFGAYTYSVPGSLEPTDNWCAFYIDADVTVTGTTGGVNCLDKVNDGECGVYAFNVRNGAKLTINGGVYHGGGTIVQAQLGTVEINGGTFTLTPFDAPYGSDFAFNCVDAAYQAGNAGFSIEGGTFVGFDPQDNKSEGAGTDYTAPGYIAVDDGTGTFTVEEGYVIKFEDYDGTVLETLRIKKGETPVPTAAPTRADDVVEAATSTTVTSYAFDGWTVAAATEDVTYTATYTPTETVTNYVAQIGSTKYETLASAWAAVPSDGTATTVTLLADVTAGTLAVNGGRNVVLDLGGKTLTPSFLYVLNGALEIANGTLAGTVCVYGLNEDGTGMPSTFTLAADATVDSERYGVIVYEYPGTHAAYDAAVTIAGTVNGNVWVMGNIEEGDSTLTVSGTVDATDKSDVGIALNGAVALSVVDGASVESDGTGIEVRAGALSVTGGTIVGNGVPASSQGNNNGTTSTGAGIAVSTYDLSDVSVSVAGGEVKGYAPLYVVNTKGTSENDLELSVSGGTFTTINDGPAAIVVDASETRAVGFVSGGTFSSAVAYEYCHSGYIPSYNSETGKYGVEEGAYQAVVIRGGKVVTGGTIAEMFANVQDGDTVKIVNSLNSGEDVYDYQIAIDSTIVITNSLTIDLNGFYLIAEDCRVFWIKSGDVTITSSSDASSVSVMALDYEEEEPYDVIYPATFSESSSVIRVGDSAANATPAKLTLDGPVTVEADYCYGVTVFGMNDDGENGADIALVVTNGATVATTGDMPAISGNGTNTLKPTAITIAENSSVEAINAYAIYHPGKGTLTVNGTVVGLGGIEVKAGTVAIGEGAEIEAIAEADNISHTTSNDGTSTTGYAIAAVGNANYSGEPEVVINGGTITGLTIALAEANAPAIGTITATSNGIVIPEGYKWVETATEGVYELKACEYVAQIGTTKYESFAEAMAAAQDGDTVTLLADVSLTERLFVNAGATPAYAGSGNRYATTSENKAITLDLNGFDITSTSNIALAGGSLTITGTGTIATTDAGLAPVEVRGTGSLASKRTLTVGSGVTLAGGAYGLNVFGSNDAQKNVIDVTVNGTVEGTLFVLGNLKNAENEINIVVNGTVVAPNATSGSPNMGIALNGNANVTVNDGAVVSGDSGIEVRAGSLTVNGGTITATASEYSYTANGSGSTTRGAAISVAQHTTVLPTTVTLAGGTLVGPEKVYVKEVNAGMPDVTVQATAAYTQTAEIPEGYKWVETATEGVYELKASDYVAQVGTQKFESLAEAVSAAVSGETVTLLKSCEGAGIFLGSSNAKTVTIDFGGFTYTVVTPVGSSGTVNQMLHFEAGNTVTLMNGRIEVTDDAEALATFEMVMQNYCNLTIEGMEIDGTGIEVATYSDPKYQAYPGWYNTAKPQFNYNGSGTSVIRDSTITVVGDFGIDDTAKVTIEGDVVINANTIATKGTDERYASSTPTITVENGAAFSFDCSAILAEDQKLVEEDGVYTVTGKTYVAQIGTTKYETLVAAVAAANAAREPVTIELLGDYDVETNEPGHGWSTTYNRTMDDMIKITGKDITFDLCGHSLYNMFNNTICVSGTNISIINGEMRVGNLYTGNKPCSYVMFVEDATNFVIDNLVTYGGINISHSTATINDLEFTGTAYYGVCAQDASSVTINGGSYQKAVAGDANYLLWIQRANDPENGYPGVASELFIKGGKFKRTTSYGTANFVLGSGVKPVITGGVFDFDATDYGVVAGYNTSANTDETTLAEGYTYMVSPITYSVTFSKGTAEEIEFVAPEVTYTVNSGKIVLPSPGYTYADHTFAAWKNGNGDTVTAIPAGTIGNISLTATWTAVKTVEITVKTAEQEPGEDPTVVSAPIKVTDAWVASNVSPSGESATSEEIQDELNKQDENGLKKWQNYVLGQAVNAAAQVVSTENSTETVAEIDLSFDVPSVDTGFDVTYRMDRVTEAGAQVEKGDEETSTPLVDLTQVETNAYFQVKAIITPKGDTAAEKAVEIEVQKVVGVMAVNSTMKNTIVAVPWESFAGDSITAGDLVYTGNRKKGDTLTVYVAATGRYKTWTLDADGGNWASVTTYSMNSAGDKTNEAAGDASDQSIPRGAGVWVYRKDVSEKIYLLGQKPADATAAAPLEAGSADKPKWNLVASPSVEEFNPNKTETPVEGATSGDQIVVPSDDATPIMYEFDAFAPEGEKWGYNDLVVEEGKPFATPVRRTNVKVPAGTGFWYLNKSDKTSINLK